MSVSAIVPPLSPAPQHVADLRPVADAIAMRRDTDPGLPVAPPPATAFPAVMPASPTARAAVGRSLMAADAALGDRQLKPWGVAMLPSTEAADRARRLTADADPAAPTTAPRDAADRARTATASPDRDADLAPPAPNRPARPVATPPASGPDPAAAGQSLPTPDLPTQDRPEPTGLASRANDDPQWTGGR